MAPRRVGLEQCIPRLIWGKEEKEVEFYIYSMTTNNLLYYSVNTKLAHYINNFYYGGRHYVWCAPVFDPTAENRQSPFANIPPSSSPHEICRVLKADILKDDTHSFKIKDNRKGLKRGATFMQNQGVITKQQYGEIFNLVHKASIQQFTPYIYIIRGDLVEGRINKVDVRKTANPLGVEYIIPDLHQSEFDAIDVTLI